MHVKEIIETLEKEYPERVFPTILAKTPYQVLVSCIISLRTKDEITFKSSKKLLNIADTPEKMRQLSEKEISYAIYPAGFYNTKAKTIKRISQRLIEEYGSVVPDTIEELMKFKGVGRKTANIVLAQGYSIPAMPVDTHVHRVPNRIGLVKTKIPDETEFALRKIIPKKNWLVFHETIVKHGQKVCKPVRPMCYKCVIIKYCNFPNKNLGDNHGKEKKTLQK